jgi:prophage regulatory protein
MQENPLQKNPSSISILRLPQVIEKIGLSRSTIYFYLSKGTFPKPISLGERSIGFLESEIIEWLQSRIALRG